MPEKVIAVNKKARHDYEFIETYTAGISLTGTEVKSLRNGKVSFGDAFCYIENGQAHLKSLHISEYTHGNIHNHPPRRLRKLLLKKNEIRRIDKALKEKGLTLVPTKLFFSERGFTKVNIALVKGKKLFDKRESLKDKDAKRQIKHFD